MEPSKFRHLVKEVSGRDLSTEQASAFLNIFGEQLEAAQTQSARDFIVKHFGKKYVYERMPY